MKSRFKSVAEYMEYHANVFGEAGTHGRIVAEGLAELAAALAQRAEAGAPELPFVVEYRRKPDEAFSYWKAMAAFDYEGPADAYAKQCYSETGPWEYRVRPLDMNSPRKEG